MVDIVLVIQKEHLQNTITSLVIRKLGQLVLVFLFVLGSRLVLVRAKRGILGKGKIMMEVFDCGLHTFSIIVII